MKVVVLCDFAGGIPDRQGNRMYVSEFIAHLSARDDLDLHVITMSERNSDIRCEGCTIHGLRQGGCFSVPYLHPWLLRRMLRLAEDLRPDIIHALSTQYPYSTAAALLRHRYPVLLTAFGIFENEISYYRRDMPASERIFSYLFHSLFILNERYVLSRVPNIVVDAPSIRDLIRRSSKSAIFVVPAGLNIRSLESDSSRLPAEESPDIVFVNNLTWLKGADLLVSALPRVVSAIPDLRVFIGGTGPQETELRRLVQAFRIGRNVRFTGYVSDAEKYAFYRSSKVVVIPSRWDCQPSALFEAAALGRPVIASDTSNPGVLQDGITGMVFRSGDAADLAAKILLLLADEERRERMGSAARMHILQYDWVPVTERYMEIYRHVVSRFRTGKENAGDLRD